MNMRPVLQHKTRTSLLAVAFFAGAVGTVIAAGVGAPLTPVIAVLPSASTPPFRSNPKIVASSSGNFAVVWTANQASPPQLHARLFNADGSPRSADFVVESDPTDFFGVATQPAAMNARGEVAVAWLAMPDQIFSDHIYAQVYEPDGTPHGGRIDVAVRPQSSVAEIGGGGLLRNPAIALNDAGELTVAWVVKSFTGPRSAPILAVNSDQLYSRRFRADGAAVGPAVLTAFDSLVTIREGIRIVMNNAGDYAIAYRQGAVIDGVGAEAPLEFPFFAKLYSADGRERGLPIHFTTLGQRQTYLAPDDFALCFVANGDLILAWASANARINPTQETILMRRYSTLGVPRGDTITVATRSPHVNGVTLSLAPIPSGGSIIVWPDYAGQADGTAYGRYYAANDVPLTAPFVVATGVRQVSATTDARGNLITAFGDVFARVFQGP